MKDDSDFLFSNNNHPSTFKNTVVVVPGQLIAVSGGDAEDDGGGAEDGFLRGHGTYLETMLTTNGRRRHVLRASVTGIVQRVNKLISVDSISMQPYPSHVGDIVVGRIVSIGNARWNVDLGSHGLIASLPLSGVHLPGSVQRIRTAADALEMRNLLREGDLVSAEVHKVVVPMTSVLLHTRSVRYGKLENGWCVPVPPKLIPRQKTHYTTILNHRFEIILGCNGWVWLQRNITTTSEPLASSLPHESSTENNPSSRTSEMEERRRREHAETPYELEDRMTLARLRACILALQMTLSEITPDAIEQVYHAARDIPTAQLFLPANIVLITACHRRRGSNTIHSR
jgi:exosome complex component RRP4